MKHTLRKATMLGVSLTNASHEEVLKYIDGWLEKKDVQGYLVTPNPEMLVLAQRDQKFKQILNQAELSLVDGVGLMLAGKVLGLPLTERFAGTDFVEEICKRYVKEPVKLGFLGGRGRVAELAVECLMKKYPGIQVSFVSDEWTRQGFANARLLMKKYEDQDIKILGDYDIKGIDEEEIGKKSPNISISQYPSIDILFVAFGFPKQEYWIVEHLPNLPVKIAIGVGGAFDYLSGTVPRAPRWAQALGLEWLYRLIRQPWRIKRQMALVKFVALVLKERLGINISKRVV